MILIYQIRIMGYLRNDDNFINADDGQRINGGA